MALTLIARDGILVGIPKVIEDSEMAQGNFVAKNLHKTSRSATHVDRRKASKGGYVKHKKSHAE